MTTRQQTSQQHATVTRRSPSGSRLGRTAAVLVTAIATLLAVIGTAQAQDHQGGYVSVGLPEGGLFYGNFDEDVLLFSGGTAVQFCVYDEPTHEARVFDRKDGSTVIKVDGSTQPIYLYATELGAPEFLDAYCDTSPPEPFAVGEGTVRMRLDIAADGSTVHVVNSTIGSASAPDGTTWKVRGWADLMVVDGVPQGSPSDFQGLRIARTGS